MRRTAGFRYFARLRVSRPLLILDKLYTSVQEGKTAILPDSINFADGSVLPLAFDTAAVGLYSPTSDGFLGLPFPSANPSSSNKTIVVWGGSGSVGCLAIQLAAASGVKVITTASAHNFDFCKKLGADEVRTLLPALK